MDYLGIDPAPLLGWITLLSVVSLLIIALAVPWVIARLPADYFCKPDRAPWRESGAEPVTAIVGGVLKNALGALLIALGLLMLVTPGQGLLTILAGFMLMNFPGKFAMERWLVRNTRVLGALNWLRRRQGQPPFEAPQPAPPRDN